MASPFGTLVLIANPRAGRGRVGDELPEVERQLIGSRLKYRIVETTGPGDATRLAREALNAGERFLVAVGGDGTIGEVVNGMLENDRPVADDAVLGVVAAGSGSDFVRTFGLPGDAVRSVRHLTGDTLYTIDAGKVTYRDGAEERSRYFANLAQAGLGGAAVRRAERMPRAFGRSRYFWGFWLSLVRYRQTVVRVRADAKRPFEGKAHNVVVANCQFSGGGIRLSPRSYPGDGFFDVQVATGPKSEAFTLLPKMYRGEHVPSPHIKELRGAVVQVDADRPLPVEADGQSLGTTPATFTIIPGAIRLKI